MKKKGLSLSQLKVKSFVTDMKSHEGQTVKGGTNVTDFCVTIGDGCVITEGTCIETGPFCPTQFTCPVFP